MTDPFNADIIQLGTVPQIFAVVKPTPNGTHNLGFFFRDNIYDYKPYSPPRNYEFKTEDNFFIDWLYTKLHNGVAVAKSVPPMNKLFNRPKAQALLEIGKKWNVSKSPLSNSSNSEMSTFFNIKVTIINGKNLISKDSNGLSDPFIVIYFNDNKEKTSVKYKTLNPEWNESFTFKTTLVDVKSVIQFTMFDKDPVKNDYMGEISVLLSEAHLLDKQTKSYELQTISVSKRTSGTITLRFENNVT